MNWSRYRARSEAVMIAGLIAVAIFSVLWTAISGLLSALS